MAYQGLCESGGGEDGGSSHSEGALRCANDLACALKRIARTDEARSLFETALSDAEAALGPSHMHTLSLMGNLAGMYRDAGQLEAALPLLRTCVERKVSMPLLRACAAPQTYPREATG